MLKSATLPPVRIDSATKRGIQTHLRANETVSAFVEDAVQQSLARRKMQKEFLARGLASAREAQAAGTYVSSEVVLKGLAARLRMK
jgi:predicted transcriptional regulator